MTILSIGHSNLTIHRFIDLIYAADIHTVVDIRSHPTSKWEWFRGGPEASTLGRCLDKAQIGYEWLPELGGWTEAHMEWADAMQTHGVDVMAYAHGAFPKQRIARKRPNAPNGTWTNQGLHDYTWFTTLPEFRQGIDNLQALEGHLQRVAIMCAEALWWKCHRSMVADYLLSARSVDVQHVMPNGRVASHRAALGNRLSRYPQEVKDTWART